MCFVGPEPHGRLRKFLVTFNWSQAVIDPKTIKEMLYPYADRFDTISGFPEAGLDKSEILERIRFMSEQEDKAWEGGKVSGSLYSGEHEHYRFLNECFGFFSHSNVLQRDLCPSMNIFEAEIIEMTLEMLNGDAVKAATPGHSACGVIGSGGTESILNAMLGYREKARAEKKITRPNIIWPVSAHPAFTKAAHLFSIEVIRAPLNDDTTVDLDFVREHINENTIAIIGSATNYPYGTVDDIPALSQIAIEKNVWLHVDGCLGGWILPWGQQLGFPNIPVFDFRLPGVTSISADTHKYGYGLKGTSVLAWRDASFRRYQYYILPEWIGGKYASPGLAGSRSGGLIAATWASMRHLGKAGYLERAKRIFETSLAMQQVVAGHPELKLLGKPTYCFSFNSPAFNVYHVNDFMAGRGWRFNGQQNPEAIHMCVTGPQTRDGVIDRFAADLDEAVAHARKAHPGQPRSGGMYGGGGGVDASVVPEDLVLTMLLDAFTDGVPG
ncbi:pyridoxal phosphate-dependent decarboxylase family protein [Burkholderia paludis]|uniref:pyridoxal phosphate-dependent decarboxylase family protein n=1 Tax=Burkholderia paludis TaxID=1506587 RepID=UPI001F1C0AD0|nr:aminotransferase class V-fold PLP-dependent enzyme [Burkholderia paludis]